MLSTDSLRERFPAAAVALISFVVAAMLFRIRVHAITANLFWAAAAFVAISLISRREFDFESFLMKHRGVQLCLVMLVSGLVSFALVGSSIWAKWALIDDHWIAHSLGPDGTLRLTEIPELMLRTEVGTLYPRFRPIYIFLGHLEVFFWGDAPGLWHASRLVMFAVSIALFWSCLAVWIGFVPSGLVVLYTLTYSFWSDIWCRLGPSESYGMLGTAMFALGSIRLVQGPSAQGSDGKHREPIYWLLFSVGAILAVGSKENLLVLVIPVLFIGALLVSRRSLTLLGAFCLFLVTGFSAFVAIRVAMGVGSGADVYGRSVAASDRLSLIVDLFTETVGAIAVWPVIVAFLGIVGMGGYLYARRSPQLGEYVRTVTRSGLALIALATLYVFQYVFYNGAWPTGIRYDFPGVLVKPLFVVALAAFGFKVMSLLEIPARYQSGVRFGIVAALAVLIAVNGFQRVIEPCREIAKATTTFCNKLDEIVSALREDPQKPLLMVCCSNPNCYEPVFSLQRFLKMRQIGNPLHLKLEGMRVDSAHERTLLETLKRISLGGSERHGFQALERLGSTTDFWVIGLNCDPEVPGGRSLGIVRW